MQTSCETLTASQQSAVKFYWGLSYKKAQYLQRRIIFLRSWKRFLTEAQGKLDDRYHNQHGFFYILELKKLLTATKTSYFLALYDKNIIIDQALYTNMVAARKSGIIDPLAIIKQIEKTYDEIKTEVSQLEQSLKKHGFTKALISSGARSWTSSYYFQFAEGYFAFINDLPPSSTQQSSLLNTRLTDGYLFFFTTIGSIILLSVDIKFIGSSSIAFRLINSIRQLPFDNIETAITLGERLGVSDVRVAANFSRVKQALGFSSYILVAALFFGFDREATVFLTTMYLAANTCQRLMGQGLNLFRSKHPSFIAERNWGLFVKQPIQHVAAVAGHYLFRTPCRNMAGFFRSKAPVTKLLADEKLCLQDSARCQKEAFRVFGLYKGADHEQTRKAWREKTKENHPDQQQIKDSSEIISAYNARDRLKDLGVWFK
jgi:hypothetical protein